MTVAGARDTGQRETSSATGALRDNHITQVIFGRSARTGWQRCRYLSAIPGWKEPLTNRQEAQPVRLAAPNRKNNCVCLSRFGLLLRVIQCTAPQKAAR
jgi:hypothetical protein